jgi:hypothetical protein
MQSFFPAQQTLSDSTVDFRCTAQSPANDGQAESSLPPRDPKACLRARNRVAAKRWRDKKDDELYNLETTNDQLRREALSFRKQLLVLQTENHVLGDELRFFQSFMTNIMNVAPKQPPLLCPPWPGQL